MTPDMDLLYPRDRAPIRGKLVSKDEVDRANARRIALAHGGNGKRYRVLSSTIVGEKALTSSMHLSYRPPGQDRQGQENYGGDAETELGEYVHVTVFC